MAAAWLIAAMLAGAAQAGAAETATVTVGTLPELRAALAEVGPGTTILVAPGTYDGGLDVRGVAGAAGRPIVVRAADRGRRPVFTGGGIHLSGVSHVELRDLVVEKVRSNGINVDDGGKLDAPARGVVLRDLVVRDAGPRGNIDGIKLSGLADFRVEGCTVERWGSSGSAVDMVGCVRGKVLGCTFRDGGDSGVQMKGGSESIVVRSCRFERAGERVLNVGGSTGMAFFRPEPRGYEAKDITVEGCTIVGGRAAVAFVGVDGAVVRRNTIIRPGRWGVRILQETREPGFVPSRNGQFIENLIVYRSDEMVLPVNVGDGTAPETFTFARNAWYAEDAPARSRPRLAPPIVEADGVFGVEPTFRDAGRGDYRLEGDALPGVGAREAR
jgi:hypothetical protein